MFRSLRARLLVWIAALVALAIVGFGTWVVFGTRRAWMADVDRGLDLRVQRLVDAVRPSGGNAFDLVLPPDALVDADRDYYAFWDPQGRLIHASHPEFVSTRAPLGRRLIEDRREVVTTTAPGLTVLAGRRVDDVTADVWRLAAGMVGVGTVTLGLVLAGSWWLIGRALTPVSRIGNTARAMIDGDLSARVPLERVESELEQLAGVLNEAFDRLYASIERQRQFTADASHDLRTPLATLEAETHWALARPRTPDDYRKSIEVCQRTARRMQNLVQSLLDLARADASAPPPRSTCRLTDVIPPIVQELQPLADAREISVHAGELSGSVEADPAGLRAALTNLLMNAIQYNVQRGSVDITSKPWNGGVAISVRDSGVGLSSEQAARVFDRFYRVDAARGGASGGAGLGLAVVSTFARSHGGSVSVTSEPGTGSTFTLHLPPQRT